MRRLPRRSSIALALAALCLFPLPSRAAAPANPTLAPATASAIPLDPVPPGGFQVALARAALEQAAGHPRAVIAQLEPIDLAAQVGPDRRSERLRGEGGLTLSKCKLCHQFLSCRNYVR